MPENWAVKDLTKPGPEVGQDMAGQDVTLAGARRWARFKNRGLTSAQVAKKMLTVQRCGNGFRGGADDNDPRDCSLSHEQQRHNSFGAAKSKN